MPTGACVGVLTDRLRWAEASLQTQRLAIARVLAALFNEDVEDARVAAALIELTEILGTTVEEMIAAARIESMTLGGRPATRQEASEAPY